MNRRRTIGQKIREFFILIPLSIGICGAGVLVYQAYLWLRTGYWKPLKANLLLSEFLPASFFQWLRSGDIWQGANKAVCFVYNSSLALFLLVFSFVLYWPIAGVIDLFSGRSVVKMSQGWRG
jgi:hypothetical protein